MTNHAKHVHSNRADDRRRPDPAREQLWRERFRQFAGGGRSVRQFCAAGGLAETAFYFWRREIQRRDGRAATITTPATASPTRPSALGTRAPAALAAATRSRGAGITFAQVLTRPSMALSKKHPSSPAFFASSTPSSDQPSPDVEHDGCHEPMLHLVLRGGRELLLPASLPADRLAAMLRAIEEAA